MKVVYDHQVFFNQKYGGISKYFSCLLKGLNNLSLNLELVAYFSKNINFQETDLFKFMKFKERYGQPYLPSWLIQKESLIKDRMFNLFYGKNQNSLKQDSNLAVKLNETIVCKILETEREALIFHPTFFSDYYIETIKCTQTPLVVTIYDLIHEKFDEFFDRDDMVIQNRKRILGSASKVIAISESTKRDLIDWYEIPPQSIKVICLANTFDNYTEFDNPDKNDYILFVGDRWAYKNFDFMIRSIAPFLRREKLPLKCIGSKEFSEAEIQSFADLGIADFVTHEGILNRKQLFEVYKNALLFIFPSLYEGFGLPLLEAQSAGTPVICSNSSSFPEVAGEGAVYFDPKDANSIQDCLKSVYESKTLRKSLRSKGFENLKRFSWSKTAAETASLYRELSNE